MDIRDMALGTESFLPVVLRRRHACGARRWRSGTAIESPMRVALQFDLFKQQALAFPRFRTSGPVTRHLDGKGYKVATGIGPDLMEAARAAVRSMVELLTLRQGMPAVDANMLCSVCGDLRISEIVGLPNRV